MSFILIPTCDTHARVCEITAALLDRHWPEHPPVHVLHYDVRPRIGGATLHHMGRQSDSPWLATLTRFLRARSEDVFLLLLDDYALCGPPRRELISAAVELFQSDPPVGFFPLCWYPASSRHRRPGAPGIVTLGRCPILLQAALWRREWFLELAEGMDGNTSPWGFESAATQRAKQVPREVCAADIPDPPYVGGHLIDGFDKRDWPLPYHNLMHAGNPDQRHDEFLRGEGFVVRPRGLGDTIARITRATGFDRVARAVQRVTGRPCGCEQRRTALNRRVSY
jgi:hypothetical protein